MAQYRYRTATMLGRWCLTREEACGDALRAGQARCDEESPGKLFWTVPGEIESAVREDRTPLPVRPHDSGR
jgi:hypothetical protein